MSAVSTPPARFPDRYGADVLSSGPPAHHRRRPVGREVPAQRDLVVEEASTGFTGAITRVEKTAGELIVELEVVLAQLQRRGEHADLLALDELLQPPVAVAADAAPSRSGRAS